MDTLQFGKFKGQKLSDTPEWYQTWIKKQPWFNKPAPAPKPLHKQLAGWDGHSRRGEAIYDQIFKQEQAEGDEQDKRSGWYEPGGMYYGI